MAQDESLGSDGDLVAVALRLLWDLDSFLADAAADRLGRLDPPQREALLAAIASMRDALANARPARMPVRSARKVRAARR